MGFAVSWLKKNKDKDVLIDKNMGARNSLYLNHDEDEHQLGVFDDVNEAIEEAHKAHLIVSNFTLDQREKIIKAIRKAVLKNAEAFAESCLKETGRGNLQDKIMKHQLAANKTPGTEDLAGISMSGDDGLTMVERSPYGVIGSIIPVTNPSETIVHNTISMIAGGNSVVFSVPRGAQQTSRLAIDIINKTIMEAGGPQNLLVTVKNMDTQARDVIMTHPKVKLLVVTGGPTLTSAALKSGKKAICASAGNPPVIVDETANVEKAAKDIIAGCTFDNNMPCISEKEAIVVRKVYYALIAEMRGNGALLLNDDNMARLERVILQPRKTQSLNSRLSVKSIEDGYEINKDLIGKDAKYILDYAGIRAKDDTKLIIVETKKNHPFVINELAMPILPIVKANDIDDAIDIAVEVEGGKKHSAMIHSNNIKNISKFSIAIDTAVFVVNGSCFSGVGAGGEGHVSYTIASASGEGLTSAKTFTRQRRCAFAGCLKVV